MGYLDNSSITVDAILTKKGRELLSKGRDEFNITQFALADDEVDYDLWNPAHPLGSAYYGIIIENMPLVEAFADESQMLRYKLVTLPKKTTRIPVLGGIQSSYTLISPGQTIAITPNTVNFDAGNKTLGYTAILSNSNVADLRVQTVAPAGVSPSTPRLISDSEAAQTVSVTGLSFVITAKQQLVSDATATLTIVGNETGGSITTTITVRKTSLATAIGTSITNNTFNGRENFGG